MSYYYAPPEIELVEDQRGYLGLRARKAVRGRKARRARSGSLHCCAARWANLRIIFNAPVAQPDVGQKPSLTARAKRASETTETTPTPKPMTNAGPREAPGDAREPHGLRR